jgi:ribonuclease I
MTIHGYWPSSTDLAYLDCFKKHRGVDPYCTDELRFDSNLFTSDELSEIEEYWPSFKGGSFESFVSYEYKKHGTCYVHLIEEEGSALPAEEIQREYILGVVDKVKELDIQLSRQKVYSKGKLADLLGLEESQFLAICKWDNELDEVRICYSVASTPGDEEIIDCPPSTDRSQCRFPMWIK